MEKSESSELVDREQEAPLPPRGPAWDAAVAFGVDMKLLLANLELSPVQRLHRLQQAAEFHSLLRAARRADE